MAVFVNTLRCRRCAIASPRRCIDARGRTYVEDFKLWPPSRPDSTPPPFENAHARCSFFSPYTVPHRAGISDRLIKYITWRIDWTFDFARSGAIRNMFLFLSGAPYRANDDYRYSESLRNITGDNRSARPTQFFAVIFKYWKTYPHTHTYMYQFVILCGIS